MQSARVVFLDHEPGGTAHLFRQRFSTLRLRCFREIALRFVFFEAHRFNLTADYADETDFARNDRTMLAFGGHRLAHEVAGKPSDYEVFAELGNF